MESKVDIYQYRDYRAFLKAKIAERRRNNSAFGVRHLAKQAAFKSPAALSMVVNRSRHLSLETAERVALALKLNQREKKYFVELVRENYCASQSELSSVQEKILKFKSRESETNLDWKQYRFLSQWYYLAIYELVANASFRNDPNWIQKKLITPISVAEIQEAVADLITLGLIQEKSGHWKQTHRAIRTSDETRNLAVRQYHQSMIEQAQRALEYPLEMREFGGLTVKVSKKSLIELKNKIREFKSEINEILSTQKLDGEVFQLNIQLFPMTQEILEKKK